MVMLSPRNDWLELTQEDPIEPDLPICDPHHHLWERPGNNYMLDDLLRDLRSGHNIVSTVFLECTSMYREDGPEHLKPLGETEFTAAVAEEAAGRSDIQTNIHAAIASNANLALGDAVAEVLEAHIELGRGRFRGIRHGTSHDPSPDIPSYRDQGPGVMMTPQFREGFAHMRRLDLTFDAWLFHPQLPELADLARSFPDVTIILDHIGAPSRRGPLRGQACGGHGNLEAQHRGGRAERECLRQSGRLRHAQLRQRLARARHAHRLGRACRSPTRYYPPSFFWTSRSLVCIPTPSPCWHPC